MEIRIGEIRQIQYLPMKQVQVSVDRDAYLLEFNYHEDTVEICKVSSGGHWAKEVFNMKYSFDNEKYSVLSAVRLYIEREYSKIMDRYEIVLEALDDKIMNEASK